MVKGLDLFKTHFQDYADQFVLIGGTACDLVMSEAGVSFRATKDLDIVLLIETLTRDFGRVFWEFIRNGGYEIREKESGARQYYRFSKPSISEYPGQLELFCRTPDGLALPEGSELTPIQMGDDVSGLSAILLDEVYYGFLKSGRKQIQGIPIVGTEHLMALKAKAWMDLTARRDRGERVDSNDILKHKRDVFRLLQIADPEFSAEIPAAISLDMEGFLGSMMSEGVDLRSLGIKGMNQDAAIESIRTLFIRK
jgi:hypothetical protein